MDPAITEIAGKVRKIPGEVFAQLASSEGPMMLAAASLSRSSKDISSADC